MSPETSLYKHEDPYFYWPFFIIFNSNEFVSFAYIRVVTQETIRAVGEVEC